MKRAVIYARYSTELQNPKSCEDQIALCQRYAGDHDITVVATYQDAAVSGTTAARDGYQAMLAATQQKPRPFDILLCEASDRVWRDPAEQSTTLRRLHLRGIEVIAASQGLSSRATGAEVQFAVQGLVSQLYISNVRDKTHRGLDSLARRGLSTGGRTYGYKSMPIDGHPTAKRLIVDQAEADVVRRIFRKYADGRSLRTIARALNAEGVPFPAKDTTRGPARKGWSRISVRFILRNERYVGRVTWNRRQFLKDPDTGKRRSILRPNSEWVTKDYPELRIVSAALWQKTADRIQLVEGRYAKATNAMFRTREARVLYSSHLLSGILTCGSCGSRMQVFSTTKGKGGRKYTQSWLRCAFAHDKGPAVCTHGTPYREDLLEADLVEHFRAAMNSEHVDRLVTLMNEAIAAELARDDRSPKDIAAEIAKLEAEAQYLVRFLASGGNFETVRSELRAIEEQIAAKKAEHEVAVERSGNGLTKVHKSRVLARLEHLHELLHRDPVRAKAEIARHLDGQLSIRPLPSNANERCYEISGAVSPGGLLYSYSEETAGRLQIIAGVGFEPTTSRL